jgi:hypothetical protein
LPGELRNKIYGYVFSTTKSKYPSPMLERDLKLKNIIELSNENLNRKDFNLRLAITQTCRQVRTETRLLPYLHAKYEMNGWFVWWLMILDDDARVVAWEMLTKDEKDRVKWLYRVMREHYDGPSANSYFGGLFADFRLMLDSFLPISD